MSIFDRLDAMVSRTVDRINAIPFEFTPVKGNPNGRPLPDSERKAVSAVGIFDYTPSEYGVQLGVRKSYREANDLRALQVGRDPQLSIDRSIFPTVEDEPRQSDLISFPTRPDLPTFQVVSAQRDGLSRMVLMLTHLGAQA